MATSVYGNVRNPVESPASVISAARPTAPEGLRYVARQPILDARGTVHGYELLFRSGPASSGFSGDGNAATRAVLDNTVIFGLEQLTGGQPVFVNCTREALLERLVTVLPPSHTVLEVLETLEPTPALLAACQELKTAGFRIALDDFEWHPAWRPFVSLADYIKVDLTKTIPKQRAELFSNLNGTHALLVAERVETHADLQMAQKEGFHLFQGYYFCRPVVLENRAIPTNRLLHLEMLQAIHQRPLDTKRISELVKRDAALTYRLLRMVNSPLYGTGKVIRSIHSALVLIGDEMFRKVTMLAIASELRGTHSSELLQMAFLRGRFCELAATMTGQNKTEQYLLGVLSLLPAMLNASMESIARSMPLRREIHQALLGQSNPERVILDWLQAYELGHWETCDQIALRAGLQASKLPALYAQALLWAETDMNLAIE